MGASKALISGYFSYDLFVLFVMYSRSLEFLRQMFDYIECECRMSFFNEVLFLTISLNNSEEMLSIYYISMTKV